MPIKSRMTCRLCDGKLETIKNFGSLPMMGVFPRPEEKVESYPLELTACRQCLLLQLRDTVDPAETFKEGFGYKSATNDTMVKHLHQRAQWLHSVGVPGPWLDIACNDNTLLKDLRGTTRRLVGIDPVGEDAVGVETIKEFFDPTQWKGEKAAIVTALAVIYDLDDPLKFVQGVRSILKDDGIFYIEVGSGTKLIQGTYDVICHEHLTFLGLHHLQMLASKAGMRMIHAEELPTNGGSFGVLLTPFESTQKTTPGLAKMLTEDRLWWDWTSLVWLGADMDKWAKDLQALMEELPRPIYALAASTKGNFTLQVGGVAKYISAAVDRGSHKVGRVIPGTGIPIIGEEEFLSMNPRSALALAWHFLPSMRERYPRLFEEGRVVVPLPKPHLDGTLP